MASEENVGTNDVFEETKAFKVLIAIDKSHHAEDAFDFYVKRLHQEQYEVLLLHVLDVPGGTAKYMSGQMWEEALVRERELAKAVEDEYAERMAKAQVKGHIKSVVGAKAGETIVETANKEHVGMIITGSRGLGKVRRTILGSVSDYVMHHANCPVIVCRHQRHGHASGEGRHRKDSEGQEKHHHKARHDSEGSGGDRHGFRFRLGSGGHKNRDRHDSEGNSDSKASRSKHGSGDKKH